MVPVATASGTPRTPERCGRPSSSGTFSVLAGQGFEGQRLRLVTGFAGHADGQLRKGAASAWSSGSSASGGDGTTRQLTWGAATLLLAACGFSAKAATSFRRAARRALRRRGCGRGRVVLAAKPRPDPESLRWTLELAIRAEDYEEAARIRTKLPDADAQRPVTALAGVVREQVRQAVEDALNTRLPAERREAAVRQMQELATPPAAFSVAEDGLHRVLSEGDIDCHAAEVAESALWDVWSASGNEEADAAMSRGGRLMHAGDHLKAVEAFTEVVEALPAFAEGWNKRATALFLAKQFDASIADCHRVLKLKPRHFGCLSGLGMCYLHNGDDRAAARWLREALEVNPRIIGLARIVSDLETRLVFTVMKSRIKEVMTKMTEEDSIFPPGPFVAAPSVRSSELSAEWDAHLVEDLEQHTYLFRVHVRNSAAPRVSGTARFYALKTAKGSQVIPLQRRTLGPAGFTLSAGESYRYSFMLTLDRELSQAEGGLFLRGGDDFFEAPLCRLSLSDVPRMSEEDFPHVNTGFHFMGRLELPLED